MQQLKATTLTLATIDSLRSTLYARGRSEKTIKAYSTDLRMFLKDLETDQISMEEFEETGMNWLQANRKVVAAKTTGRRLTSLKAFAKYAGWGVMFTEYSAPVPPKGDPHPLPEGAEGVYRLIRITKNEKQKALIALCGLCGCRVAEALAVMPGDFNLSTMTLTVHGKGDKQRIVPVSDMAWSILATPVTRAFCEGDRPVVGLQDRFARRVITRLGVRAGLRRHISSHDLRATFATEVYNKTLDLRLTQELLGHSSSQTTELYTGVTQAKMREAVNF